MLENLVIAIEKASNMTGLKFENEEKLDDFYQNNPNNFTVAFVFEYYNASSFSYTVKTDQSKMVKIGSGKSKTSNEGKKIYFRRYSVNSYIQKSVRNLKGGVY